jgi:16S rRNA (cytosine967-C5)-methyltransferase
VAEFRKVLDQEGISYETVSELPDAVRVVARSFTEHKQYKEGNCFFMDASSQRIAYLVDLCDSRLVADLCAAPGGKAFLMASRLQPGGRIFCSDINGDRLRQTRRRADLYGITELSFVQMDLTVGTAYTNCFDAVLLDVPCSGTGTFRANPDARWRMGEEDLLRFQQRQLKLLHSAFSILGPGRELVYSTCSTEPEENEHVVEQFLASEESAELSAGYFQTLPYRDQGEGFFAARVRRV